MIQLQSCFFANYGFHEQGAIASVLWDLYDSVDDDESISDFSKIWSALTGATKPKDIKVFWEQYSVQSGVDKTIARKVFEKNGVLLAREKFTTTFPSVDQTFVNQGAIYDKAKVNVAAVTAAPVISSPMDEILSQGEHTYELFVSDRSGNEVQETVVV
ncbi:MAG: hypothetical protein JKX97_05840 [Candidatus Lindowbacteria bacterium]|nr:hypothetical protein [Candidatus Lindowbacteria bacterium]